MWTSEEGDGADGSSKVRMSHHRHGLAARDTFPGSYFVVVISVFSCDHHESLGLLLPCAVPLLLTTLGKPHSLSPATWHRGCMAPQPLFLTHGTLDSSPFLLEKPWAGVFHHQGFAPLQKLPRHRRSE